MHGLSSVLFETKSGEQILLSAVGMHTDPLRVFLMTEADYLQASSRSGRFTAQSQAMPILSLERPTITLTMLCPGKWRIVYQTVDTDSVTVAIE